MSSRRWSCLRKLRHLDYLSALRHAARVPCNETVNIYPCRYCHGLHVGHASVSLARRISRTEKRIARARARLDLCIDHDPQQSQRERQRIRDLCNFLALLKQQSTSTKHDSRA